MKASKYNIILEENGVYLMFNTISCFLVTLDKEGYDNYMKITSNDPYTDTSEPGLKDLIEQLMKGSFIVDDHVDELGAFKQMHDIIRNADNYLTVTILPTTACNLDCKYCYEGEKKPIFMSRETEDSTINYIDEHMKYGGRLSVTWFGGEPGIASDIVLRLSKRLKQIVDTKNLSYFSLYITNGYTINREMVENLVRYGLGAIQITLDGIREIHDARRPLKNGGGSYDVIMKNLKNIAGMANIYLRTNIDRNNEGSYHKLLDEIEANGLRDKVVINIGNTEADTDACFHYRDSTYNVQEYSKVATDLYEMLLKRNFTIDDMLPHRHYVKCSSICTNGLRIYSNGDSYKCLGYFGRDDKCIGNINHPESLELIQPQWLSWDPFSNKHCVDCAILPFCQGGCYQSWIEPTEYIKIEERCSFYKYALPDIIRLKYRYGKKADNSKDIGQTAG